jgi:type I restriction enzyme, S subunit
MSRLDELIQQHAPNGVLYVKLKEVAQISAGGDLPENYVKGQKVPTAQYPYPIYSNGTEDGALYGFTDSYKIEKDAVTISARGTIGYHEVRAGKFTPIVRLITIVADESKITTKFLHYALYVAGIEGITTGIPSLTVPMLEKFTIPLPPLEEQARIVAILDRFDALCNDLTHGLPAEIAARKKQYEYYRDRLLNFEEAVS